MKSALLWGIAIGGCALLLWLLVAGGADPLLWLQPSFRVAAMDLPQKQMTLLRQNHRYVVNCGNFCSLFQVGKYYRFRERGGVLKYRELELRVLEEQIYFQTGPGGLG